MFFAQLKSAVRSLRFRLMIWNAFIMLIASLGVLWGLREGVRYTLVTELDDNLHDDLNEISDVLISVFEADNPFFQTGMDRKARGHKQRSWFLQVADVRTPQQRALHEQRRREWARRFPRTRGRPDSSRTREPNANEPETATTAAETGATGAGAEPNRNDNAVALGSGETPSASESALNAEGSQSSAKAETPASSEASLHAEKTPASTKSEAEEGPPILWQTFNVPDWSMLNIPKDFHKFGLVDGKRRRSIITG